MTDTSDSAELAFRTVRFSKQSPLVIAVIPVTPSLGIGSPDMSVLMATVERAVDDGADIVEFSPASSISRTGAANAGQELARLVGSVSSRYPEHAVAVTPTDPAVAREVCDAGAHLLRGVHGQANHAVRDVAATYGAGFVVVRSASVDQLKARVATAMAERSDALVRTVIDDLTHGAESAVASGVPSNGVLVDPGLDTIGSPDLARTLMGQVKRLVATGWPVVASLSVGMFEGVIDADAIRDSLNLVPPTVLALMDGAVAFRTNANEVATTSSAVAVVSRLWG